MGIATKESRGSMYFSIFFFFTWLFISFHRALFYITFKRYHSLLRKRLAIRKSGFKQGHAIGGAKGAPPRATNDTNHILKILFWSQGTSKCRLFWENWISKIWPELTKSFQSNQNWDCGIIELTTFLLTFSQIFHLYVLQSLFPQLIQRLQV